MSVSFLSRLQKIKEDEEGGRGVFCVNMPFLFKFKILVAARPVNRVPSQAPKLELLPVLLFFIQLVLGNNEPEVSCQARDKTVRDHLMIDGYLNIVLVRHLELVWCVKDAR